VFNLQYAAIWAHKKDIKRNTGIFHPDRRHFGLVKLKQHARIISHAVPIHHTACLKLVSIGNLDCEYMSLILGLDRQFLFGTKIKWLRLTGLRKRRSAEKHENSRYKNKDSCHVIPLRPKQR